MQVVAILETMWGERAGRAPRYFKINPYNCSGRRLYKLIGPGHNLLVTNACRELVTSANKHGKPDAGWLLDNLMRLQPDLILVCGKVAQKTFEETGYNGHEASKSEALYIAHPAARNWTSKRLKETQKQIQKQIQK